MSLTDREEQKVSSMIDDMFDNEKTQDYDEIVDELQDSFDCFKDDIEIILNRKIQNGELFEPEPGKLERLDAQ